MRLKKHNIFIVISSIALITVLIIQVNWMLETAKIKEELFNEKANIVLARTSEALLSDSKTCRNIDSCIGKADISKIDSLFKHYMVFYNFHIDFTFEIISNLNKNKFENSAISFINKSQPACYQKNLNELSNKTGVELKLILPEKNKFILAEMGNLFISSVLLIIIVLILFWKTTLSLIKEKKISQNTTDFLNNMTHEFKTPLTNIALANKMIIKNNNLKYEEKINHYSDIIFQESEKLKLHVEQMLSMAALERDEFPLQNVELNFHQLINDSIKCIGIQIENRHGDLKLNLNATKFAIIGDKTHLLNVLCNLIDNAIKYSNDNPEITIQTDNINQNLKIEISDSGIGIEKEYQKKIFDTFFRIPTQNLHNVKGFGIGLSYSKKIIELHHGSIDVKSEKGKGTTFTIILPYV